MKNNNDKSKWEIEAFKRGTMRKSRKLFARSEYSNVRNSKDLQLNHTQSLDIENIDLKFAERQSMRTTWFKSSNLSVYGFCEKYLTSSIGQDWDTVFSKFMRKLPNTLQKWQTKDAQSADSIYSYIAVNVEIRNGVLVDCRRNKRLASGYFYVCPETNKVCQIPFEVKPKKEKTEAPIKPSVEKAKAEAKKAEQAQKIRELLTASNQAKKEAKEKAKKEANLNAFFASIED
jgi:hypothetical protein